MLNLNFFNIKEKTLLAKFNKKFIKKNHIVFFFKKSLFDYFMNVIEKKTFIILKKKINKQFINNFKAKFKYKNLRFFKRKSKRWFLKRKNKIIKVQNKFFKNPVFSSIVYLINQLKRKLARTVFRKIKKIRKKFFKFRFWKHDKKFFQGYRKKWGKKRYMSFRLFKSSRRRLKFLKKKKSKFWKIFVKKLILSKKRVNFLIKITSKRKLKLKRKYHLRLNKINKMSVYPEIKQKKINHRKILSKDFFISKQYIKINKRLKNFFIILNEFLKFRNKCNQVVVRYNYNFNYYFHIKRDLKNVLKSVRFPKKYFNGLLKYMALLFFTKDVFKFGYFMKNLIEGLSRTEQKNFFYTFNGVPVREFEFFFKKHNLLGFYFRASGKIGGYVGDRSKRFLIKYGKSSRSIKYHKYNYHQTTAVTNCGAIGLNILLVYK